MSLYVFDGATAPKRLIFGVGIGTIEGSDYLLVSFTGSSGNGTGSITLSGENYLTLVGNNLNANPVNVAGSNITGILASGSFPALTGDVTTVAGFLATTIQTGTVTNNKLA